MACRWNGTRESKLTITALILTVESELTRLLDNRMDRIDSSRPLYVSDPRRYC